MSRHDDQVSLHHMLDHAREAKEMTHGRQSSDLETNRMLQLALTRLVEIVGEAASRVSAPTREKYPEIPWPDILGMRNRLVHAYEALDLDLLWDTIETDFPPLISQLEAIVVEDRGS